MPLINAEDMIAIDMSELSQEELKEFREKFNFLVDKIGIEAVSDILVKSIIKAAKRNEL